MVQPPIDQTEGSTPRFFPGNLPFHLGGLLDRLQPSEQVVLFITALLVGITTGVGAVAFRYLIDGVQWIGYDWIPDITSSWGSLYVVLVPAVGGLLVGLLVYFFAREAKGHGVPEVMEAVALKGGRIRPIVAVVKSVASSISIGSGGSVGREGPIVQIGSALGSSIGQALRLSDDRIRNLVACGAAGGIAATFNAPIAGVIFSLEVILHSFNVRYFSTVVISAVSASVIGQAVFGDVPAFPLPMQYNIESNWEFGLYPILGVLAAITGAVFVHTLYWSEDLFASFKRVPEWVQPAIGGALLGGLALAYPIVTGLAWTRIPHVFNVGYEVIEGALLNQLLLGTVVILLFLKLIATCLTLGSGGSGGVFAPSLFMGAMLGTAFGLVANMIFPETTAPPGAYALVGMAAVFAASAQAPITAVLILFELTGDYRIILPLMLTVVVATLLAHRMLKGESIYTLKLTRRGVRLEQGHDIDVMQGVLIGEAMTTNFDTVDANLSLIDLEQAFLASHHHGFPVVDADGGLFGVVTLQDLKLAAERGSIDDLRVRDIATTDMLVAYPDEPMWVALKRMGARDLGRLPVVSREDERQLLGMIRRGDIVRAYNLAMARRAEVQERQERLKLGQLTDMEFIDLELVPESPVAGCRVGDLSLPHDCLLVSIRRGRRVIIPRGDSSLEAGDHLTLLVGKDKRDKAVMCFGSGTERLSH